MKISDLFPLPHQDPWDTFANSSFNIQKKEWVPILILSDVDVLGDTSLVASKDGCLVEGAIDESLYWNPGPFPFDYLKNSDITRAVIEERKRFLVRMKDDCYKFFGHNTIHHPGVKGIYLCHPFGFYAYGHLHDSLQRLYSIYDSSIPADCKLVVSRYNRISEFTEHLSALMGRNISAKDIIQVSGKEIHRFESLIIPFSPSMPTTFTPETYDWTLTGYLNRFIEEPLKKPTQRLYLSRNHVAPGSRSVVNETDVREVLESNGFTVLFGNEPLSMIVDLFYNAECVVGPHGSLFANTMFCRPETRIVEYCPSNRLDYSFKNKYKLARQYEHISTHADDKFNIAIPVDELRRLY